MNDISETLFFNQRLIISQAIKEPLAWRVTKVEDLNPKGVRRLTFAADKYDQNHDYIERDEEGNVVGMYADWFQSAIAPDEGLPQNDTPLLTTTSKIDFSGTTNKIKIGGAKTFTLSFYEDDLPVEHETGEWTFFIDDENITDQLDITYPSPEKVRIKLPNDDDLIGKILSVVNTTPDGIVSSVDVELIAL